MGKVRLSQEGVVFALALFLFVAFSLTLNNFLTSGNLIALVRSVAILGILGLGMGLVVIGRGIDLAMVATMVVSLSWVLSMAQSGVPLATALLLGALLALGIGLLSGSLVAYADIPAIFTTLAMGLVAYGAGRAFLFQIDVQNTPAGIEWFNFLGTGVVLGIPMPIVSFGTLAALLAAVLRYTALWPLCVCRGRQCGGGAHHGDPASAADRRPVCDHLDDRLPGWCRHGGRGLQHEHARLQLHHDL